MGFQKAAAQKAAQLEAISRKSLSTKGFNHARRHGSILPQRLPPRSPNLNAYCERFIQTLQDECLDRFMVLGTAHLDHLTREYADYYNRQRPHSAIAFRSPIGPPLRLRGDPQ